MDFEKLLSVANSNEVEAKYEASRKRYSTVLPPPKKVPKSNVNTDQIQKFLARKQKEEMERAVEARKKKEQLLALRATNTKNNKKAKIMASRTKDNDFSRIKLTEDEVEAKQKRERELQRLELQDKVERMKARIELEEKEKLLPRKRKKKNKQSAEETQEENENPPPEVDVARNDLQFSKSDKARLKEQKVSHKKPPPRPENKLNFYDLLKVASQKQYEPIELPKVEVKEDRPLTKKAKRLLLEEENRARRKLAAAAGVNLNISPTSNHKTNEIIGKKPGNHSEAKMSNNRGEAKTVNNLHSNRETHRPSNDVSSKAKSDVSNYNQKGKPTVVRIEKVENGMSKSKVPSSKGYSSTNSNLRENTVKPKMPSDLTSKPRLSVYEQQRANLALANNTKKSVQPSKQRVGQQAQSSSSKKSDHLSKKAPVTSKPQSKPVQNTAPAAPAPAPAPVLPDLSSLTSVLAENVLAQIESRLAQKYEKEMQTLKEQIKAQTSAPPVQKTVPVRTSENSGSKRDVPSGKLESKKPLVKPQIQKNPPLRTEVTCSSSKKSVPAPSKKQIPKDFHPNPYLLPPRRLLETQRPQRPPIKRRIESDDDDDDDDEMSDFIDDDSVAAGTDDDYSKYIKEIFNYDRSKYVDDDDDEVVESSYNQQMQEEIRSAKIGYLEDLEEEQKEREEMKRKLLKKKKMKK